MNKPGTSRFHLIAYSVPITTMWFMHGPVIGVLPAIYAKYFGISLAATGTVLLIARLFDAVTDPLIGYLSDRTHTRIGRRKPWLIAGSALSVLCVHYLFMPPETPSVYYYGFWLILLFLAWTMNEIPYGAWGTELTRDYNDRSRLFTYRAWFREAGTIAFLLTPLVMYYFGFVETSEITPDVLSVVAWGITILLPISVAVAITRAPVGAKVSTSSGMSIRELVISLKINKPLRMFLPIYVIAGIAVGMYGAMSFLYVDSYLRIGDRYPLMMIISLLAALASYPAWLAIVRRFGKHRTWAVSNIVFGLGVLPIALIEPGPQAFVPYLALYLFGSVAQGAGSIVPPSILADVIDYDILRTGVNRAGSYLSLTTLLFKLNIAIGSAVAFYLISLLGFDVSADSQTVLGTFGVNLTALFLPALCFIIAGIGIWFFPIDRRRAEIIRRRIESRSARAARDAVALTY